MDYENCEYYLQKDVTPWHGDVFDHPKYKCFCTKNEEERELIYPAGQCKRCKENSK